MDWRKNGEELLQNCAFGTWMFFQGLDPEFLTNILDGKDGLVRQLRSENDVPKVSREIAAAVLENKGRRDTGKPPNLLEIVLSMAALAMFTEWRGSNASKSIPDAKHRSEMKDICAGYSISIFQHALNVEGEDDWAELRDRIRARMDRPERLKVPDLMFEAVERMTKPPLK